MTRAAPLAFVRRGLATATALAVATTANSQTFAYDMAYIDGMNALGMNLLIDVPVGEAVYISDYAFCHQDGALFAIGLTRIEPEDILIGLVEVTRQSNGSLDVVIPDVTDPYGEDYGFEQDDLGFGFQEEGDLTLWSLLQALPCTDWQNLASDPATLLAVASIDGATSMSALIAARNDSE